MQNQKLTFYSIVAAVAGFLFGFDTVVISGANEPIKSLWSLSPFFHGTFIMSMALWGTVIGALGGGLPTERYGRKKTLFWIGIMYAISALGSALAPDPYTFSIMRFIGGIGVGISSVTVPTYLAEISPSKGRGSLVARYQFMIVFGIFIAFFSNYLLKGVGGDWDWRLMLGIEAIPAILYSILVLGVVHSPRWLYLNQNRKEDAAQVLKKLGIVDIEESLADMKSSVASTSVESLFSKAFSTPLKLAFVLAFFNQLSGINFILYYAPEILETAGLAGKDSLRNAIYIGGINLIFTVVGMYFIDRLGRKVLMIIGSIGYIIGLFMVAYCFYASLDASLLLLFILLFIAAHAIGQGAVIWVYISEIFPTRVRALGQSFGSGVHWVLAAMITLITPVFLDGEQGIYKDNPYPIFIFFGVFMIFQLVWVLFVMPETKGKSLETLEDELVSY